MTKDGSKHLFLILLLGAALRAYHLGYKSLGLDEAVVYTLSQLPLSSLFSGAAGYQTASLPYLLVVRLVSYLGDTQGWLRLPSMFGGVFSMIALYFCCRCFMKDSAALLSTALFACSPKHIFYAQYLREYSSAFFLAALTTRLFYIHYCRPNLTNTLWLASLCALALVWQYGFPLFLTGLALAYFLSLQKKDLNAQLLKYWLLIVGVNLIALGFSWYFGLRLVSTKIFV